MIKNKIVLLLFVVPLFGYASEVEPSKIDQQMQQDNGSQVVGDDKSTVIEEQIHQNDTDKKAQQNNDEQKGDAKIIQEPIKTGDGLNETVHDEWLSKAAQPNEIQEHEASEAKNSRNRFDNPDDERLLNEAFADIVESKQTEPTIKHDNKLLRGLAEVDLQALEKAFDTALAQDIKNNQLKPISQDEFDKAVALNASKLLDEMVNNKKIGWRLYFMGYPFTYGFIFGIGLGFGYALCNTLYNKYGEQWKAAFKRLIHACKNKICQNQNKMTVDTL